MPDSGGAGAAVVGNPGGVAAAGSSAPSTSTSRAATAGGAAGASSAGASAASGKQASSAPVVYTEAKLKELLVRRTQLKDGLQSLEQQIFAMEGSYLQDTQSWGNIFRGWDGYTNTKTQSQGGRTRRFKESDRLFSSSSLSAPVRKATGGDDDDVDERRKRKKDKRVREMKKIRTDTSYDQ